MVSNLASKQEPQQWPPHKSDKELENEFATYFQEKIDKIQKAFSDKPLYKPTKAEAPKLRRFTPLTERQVHNVITSLKSKSCELDPVPITIFNKLLLKLLPLITKIANTSLTEGIFIQQWKTAIGCPLLKKLGLQPIHANF